MAAPETVGPECPSEKEDAAAHHLVDLASSSHNHHSTMNHRSKRDLCRYEQQQQQQQQSPNDEDSIEEKGADVADIAESSTNKRTRCASASPTFDDEDEEGEKEDTSMTTIHNTMMTAAQSFADNNKRVCVPLTTLVPSFQGDADTLPPLPAFSKLVNYAKFMDQRGSGGTRACVMCGQQRPFNKKPQGHLLQEKAAAGAACPIIPTQNKNVCTECDVKVWIVCRNGLQVKWCKGCKTFRTWAAFGPKGFNTKCVPCRNYQRELYALKKEKKQALLAEMME